MYRREFIKFSFFSLLFLNTFERTLFSQNLSNSIDLSLYQSLIEKNQQKFDEYINAGKSFYTKEKEIGELISFLGTKFLDTPYAGGTLEGDGEEICRFNLNEVDCFTLTENLLCLARIIQKQKYSIEDFIAELIFTRYRNGVITDYTSRLHYTSDWIYDNTKKNVLTDITHKLGGEKINFSVNFMSQNPNYYLALVKKPEFVEKISLIEKEISKRESFYIPNKKIKKVEFMLKSGDIIGIVTNKTGLDYSHIGIIHKKNDQALFLHASSSHKKVILDNTISEYAKQNKNCIGISICRANNVN